MSDWTPLCTEATYPWRRKLLGWQTRGLTWTATGYGPKIPTSCQMYVAGRWRRVYVSQRSNAGTAYSILNKVRRIVFDFNFGEEEHARCASSAWCAR